MAGGRGLAVLLPRRRLARPVRLVGLAQHPGDGAGRRHQHHARADHRRDVRHHVPGGGQHRSLAAGDPLRRALDLRHHRLPRGRRRPGEAPSRRPVQRRRPLAATSPVADSGAGRSTSGQPAPANDGAGEPSRSSNAAASSSATAVGPKVLRNVDLAVRRGHIHGLIGPNGSGKSTLANIIAGRLRPQAGTILVKGVPVDGLAPQRAREARPAPHLPGGPAGRANCRPAATCMVGLYSSVPGIVRRARRLAAAALGPSRRRLDADAAPSRRSARSAPGNWVDAGSATCRTASSS